jgi:hypothetical protein
MLTMHSFPTGHTWLEAIPEIYKKVLEPKKHQSHKKKAEV